MRFEKNISLFDFFNKYGFSDGRFSQIGFSVVDHVCEALNRLSNLVGVPYEFFCNKYFSSSHNECRIQVRSGEEALGTDRWDLLEELLSKSRVTEETVWKAVEILQSQEEDLQDDESDDSLPD